MPEETHRPTQSPSRHVDDILALIDAVLEDMAPGLSVAVAADSTIELRSHAA